MSVNFSHLCIINVKIYEKMSSGGLEVSLSIYVIPLSENAPTVLYNLYVLMSWPEDIDMLWMKFLSFVSVFCFANLSCFMIVHIDKKWRGT